MRTVTGPTERVVVVGAGLAGLSAALRLAGAGRQVTVLECAGGPGGRAGVLDSGGYRLDTGPSVLTMPQLIDDALACVGERASDRLRLHRVEPAYRARFADGSSLDVLTDVDAMAEQVSRVCGARDADGYRRFVAAVRRLYEVELPHFIDRNLDSPRDLIGGPLARLVALGGFRRLAPMVGSYVRDDRLRRLLSFQAMYAGVAPDRALALYAVITYMDCVGGVWFPEGGMHAVPEALAAAAADHGVDLRYDTEVTRVQTRHGRAVAVHTAAGERVAADVVVLTPDTPVAWRELLAGETAPRRVRRHRPSPSCWLALVGSRSAPPAGQAHHTLHFGQAWGETFRELVDRGQLQTDPSLLVTCPSVTDPSLAPAGASAWSVLVPTPHLGAGPDWRVVGPRYRDEVEVHLRRLGYGDVLDSADVVDVTTPADWARQGLASGTPFAAAHTFSQTGPFRAPNLVGENLVFAGSGTVPGVGVPMVLLSGRLAAARILGESVR